MKRSTDRVLTTHTGSLPRTPSVLRMLEEKTAGQGPDRAAFDAAVKDGVNEVVRQQVDAGIDIVNDGEMSKFSFANYHMDRLSGFTMMALPESPDPVPVHAIAGEAADYPEFFERWAFNARSRAGQGGAPVCTGPIEYADVAAIDRDIQDVLDAARATGATEVFMSAAPPTGMGGGFGRNEYYATEDEYNEAMADAMRVEYEAIVNAGIVLQLDCNWGVLSRIGSRLGPVDSLEEVRRVIAHSIEVMNYATRNIDPDSMRIHLCWGADEAPHHRDTPLEAIVDLMLTARPNGLGVVASNGRHAWEWKVWETVRRPEGKVIIPGVIDSTTNIIEHPETVAERIVRYAGVLGRENVIAGVDCGLDTLAGSAQVVPRIAWAKLESLAAGARLATAALYP